MEIPPLPTPFPIPTPDPNGANIDLSPFWDMDNLGIVYSSGQTAWQLLNTYHLLDIFIVLLAIYVVWQWIAKFTAQKDKTV